ncbi:hypothetical protein [Methylobacterium sp. Leaf466]|uniref:hypothetical protein n=1 Tax=Methylobacterium sp. Leaf466 TaxID=1736386 RepID=UPI0006F56A3A|nr:hypothetical protein [Methylobacterium sp. Leaf466]KQT77419.1 hypothetical protein ASG59_12655 [Methylobacterium sp. Leaf466]
MYDGLIKKHTPSADRASKAEGGVEDHLTEGAVQVAFAMHLLTTVVGLMHVAIHPDGEHAKQFDFEGWLAGQGFAHESTTGTKLYAGIYRHADGRTVLINPKSGIGDVLADHLGQGYVAECKGGVVNSRHSGQLSRLRKGLCEAVGLSMAVEKHPGRRQFAVVPNTPTTLALAEKLSKRSAEAGIEIVLVDASGRIVPVPVVHY